jgi:glutamine synthetase
LRPDIETLREMPWQKKEAIVMADVYDPESEKPLAFAPRHVIKDAVKGISGVDTQILFSFVLHKIVKDEKDQ